MNYTPIKKAMIALGFPVEDNELWGHKEVGFFRDFSHFYLNVPADQSNGILQYPEHFAAVWANIYALGGTEPQDVADIIPEMPMASAAPIEQLQEQPEQPPVEQPPEQPSMTFNVIGSDTPPEQPPVNDSNEDPANQVPPVADSLNQPPVQPPVSAPQDQGTDLNKEEE